MFVRSIFVFLSCAFILSCRTNRQFPASKNIYKAEVNVCNQSDDTYKFYASLDTLNNLTLRLYTSVAFKIAEVIVRDDTSFVSYAISDDLKDNIQFQLNKFSKIVCLKKLLLDILNQSIFLKPDICYSVIKDEDNENNYIIYDLNNQRLFEMHKIVKKSSKIAFFKFSNESFCIEFYLNKLLL